MASSTPGPPSNRQRLGSPGQSRPHAPGGGRRFRATLPWGPQRSGWHAGSGQNGDTVGKVTSAVYSPRLEQNVALAMVSADCADIGEAVEVATPQGPVRAVIAERPFFDPGKTLPAA